MSRCGPCGLTHDKCVGQVEAEALVHQLALALAEHSPFHPAVIRYEGWQ